MPYFGICLQCKDSFTTNLAYKRRRPNSCKFCSKECYIKYARDNRKQTIRKDGYVHIGHDRVHRLIMQEKLGRKLLKTEHVHHKNGIKSDNRLENLEVLTESEHHKLHPTPRRGDGIERPCKVCGKVFYTQKSNNHYIFCSLPCYWKAKKGKPLRSSLKGTF